MKKAGFLLANLFLFIVLYTTTVSAAGNCQAIYGGGQVCPTTNKFNIDKKVLKPVNGEAPLQGEYVDNLSINDPKYTPDRLVNFRIEVKNTGDQKIDKIEVTDTLPEFLTYAQGVGTYDTNRRTLTFNVTDLEAGKSQVFTIIARTVVASKLPNDRGVVCDDRTKNNVYGRMDSNNSDTDSSQICIEKSVLGQVVPQPVTPTTPSTGPEMLALLGLLPAGLTGFILKRKSRIHSN